MYGGQGICRLSAGRRWFQVGGRHDTEHTRNWDSQNKTLGPMNKINKAPSGPVHHITPSKKKAVSSGAQCQPFHSKNNQKIKSTPSYHKSCHHFTSFLHPSSPIHTFLGRPLIGGDFSSKLLETTNKIHSLGVPTFKRQARADVHN